MRALAAALAVFCQLAVVACTSDADGQVVPQFAISRTSAGVIFSGEINPVTTNAITAEITSGDTLIIRSRGGQRDSARQLSNVIEQREVILDINSECYSACSLYLAMKSPRVLVNEGATLLFHSTPQLWNRAVREQPQLFTDEDRQTIAADGSWVEAALKARGVSLDLLTCIDNATQPRISEATRISGAELSVRIPYGHSYVWLSADVLRSFGVAHFDLNWTLPPSARNDYEALKGLDIAWVDTLADCGLAST